MPRTVVSGGPRSEDEVVLPGDGRLFRARLAEGGADCGIGPELADAVGGGGGAVGVAGVVVAAGFLVRDPGRALVAFGKGWRAEGGLVLRRVKGGGTFLLVLKA